MEEQVQKEKENAVEERRELFNTRRGKQQELKNVEFKIEMAELVSGSSFYTCGHVQFNSVLHL